VDTRGRDGPLPAESGVAVRFCGKPLSSGTNRLAQFLSEYCAEWIISRADVQGASRCKPGLAELQTVAKVTDQLVTQTAARIVLGKPGSK